MLPKICKENHPIKFGQLIEYNKGNIFVQISCRKLRHWTSYRLFLFPKKNYGR